MSNGEKAEKDRFGENEQTDKVKGFDIKKIALDSRSGRLTGMI